MRKYQYKQKFTTAEIDQAKKLIKAKYLNPDGYTKTFKDSNLCRFAVNFIDFTSFSVVMTNRQRDCFFKNQFSAYVISLGGEGYQTKKVKRD